jgi:hypothetical protein
MGELPTYYMPPKVGTLVAYNLDVNDRDFIAALSKLRKRMREVSQRISERIEQAVKTPMDEMRGEKCQTQVYTAYKNRSERR